METSRIKNPDLANQVDAWIGGVAPHHLSHHGLLLPANCHSGITAANGWLTGDISPVKISS